MQQNKLINLGVKNSQNN